MATIDSLTSDAELRAMVMAAIGAVASSQTGPVTSATKAADALLIAAAIMIEANPQFAGSTGLESAAVTTARDFDVYLVALRDFAKTNGQPMLLHLTASPTVN